MPIPITLLPILGTPALAEERWSPRAGVWFEAPPPAEGVVVAEGDTLVFRGFGAAAAATTVPPGKVRWSAVVDPVVGDTKSLGWVSVMLSTSDRSMGWVTGSEHFLGMLLRSTGAVQLFSLGSEVAVVWADQPPRPAETYSWTLRLEHSEGVTLARGSVNEAKFEARLAAEPPSELHVLVGAHFDSDDVHHSTLTDIRIR